MKIKRKAFEVTLSNGETVLVHEPRIADMGVFVRAIPALQAMTALFRSAAPAEQIEPGMIVASDAPPPGIIGLPNSTPTDDQFEAIYPLFAIMTNITVDEFKDLPFWDGMAIINTLEKFVPNVPAAKEVTD